MYKVTAQQKCCFCLIFNITFQKKKSQTLSFLLEKSRPNTEGCATGSNPRARKRFVKVMLQEAGSKSMFQRMIALKLITKESYRSQLAL